MQAKRVRCVCVCVLPHEFTLIHLHGFLTALPRPLLSPILGLVNAALASVSVSVPASPTSLLCWRVSQHHYYQHAILSEHSVWQQTPPALLMGLWVTPYSCFKTL